MIGFGDDLCVSMLQIGARIVYGQAALLTRPIDPAT